MRILFDSKKIQYKDPFGTLTKNEPCAIHVGVPTACNVLQAFLIIDADDGFHLQIPMPEKSHDGDYVHFGVTFSLFRYGLYFYYFRFCTPDATFDLFRHSDGGTNIGEGDRWQISCCPEYPQNPDSCSNIIYQIFPDRFAREGALSSDQKMTPFRIHEEMSECPSWEPDESGHWNNDFFGGNLKGITSKLPYLKSLSVSLIYLNPIFKAYSNHRYDTADYKTIDPLLGTEDDFRELCRKAHKLGIRIILDGVFSHTGSDSIYFDEYNRFGGGAAHNINSQYRSWYKFRHWPDQYDSWWGIRTLPCTNELDPSFLDYIIFNEDSVTAHWMRLGADGFRLDVADELPDEFILMLRKRMKEINPDALLFGEVWEDASNKISYSVRRKYFSDGELDGVMNYPFREAIVSAILGRISSSEFESRIMRIAENYPKHALDASMIILSTHDTARILSVFGEEGFGLSKTDKATFSLSSERRQVALRRLKAAVVLQFTLPGSPCIYYGDEAGAEGFEDPFNRKFFPWDDQDTALTEFYTQMASIRTSSDALCRGTIRFGTIQGVIAFQRCSDKERIFVVVNVADAPFGVNADGKDVVFNSGRCENSNIILNKYESLIYKKA